MTTKDENRAAYPEMTAIIDQVRATGGTVTAAWARMRMASCWLGSGRQASIGGLRWSIGRLMCRRR